MKAVDNRDTEEPRSLVWPDDTRILLVEDNKVNQLVAKGILQNLGLTADIANNGQEALGKLKQSAPDKPYSLVLMDCQMPVLDGYAATGKIRSGACQERYQLIPIIAMTANSMEGDRENCLLSGMSDYLSKPIDSERLQSMLLKWLCGKRNGIKQQVVAKPSVKTGAKELKRSSENTTKELTDWDKEGALKRFKGKAKRLLPLIELFLEDMPQRVEELQQAIKEQKQDDARIAAHTIKGVAANLSALRLQQMGARMEACARQSEWPELELLMPELEVCYNILTQKLEQFQQEHNTALISHVTEMDKQHLKPLLLPVLKKLQKDEYIDSSDLEPLQLKLADQNTQKLLDKLQYEITHFNTVAALEIMNQLLSDNSDNSDNSSRSIS